jgi:exo-beta-1,3-glucanase (GH17 family)/cellulose synthase/poly-beta-1,6-N-acetylglucosamine synthase-like glycosyltransferase
MSMSRTSFAVLLAIVAANFLVWAVIGRPVAERDWSGLINGVSFSPYREADDPTRNRNPTPAEIDEDLRRLHGVAGRVRTYSSLDGLDLVPYLARSHDLRVTAGAWLDTNRDRDQEEIRHLIAAARNNRNVDRVLVGNESLLRGDLTPAQLIAYLRKVRAALDVPVSTAEPWHVWLAHPELANEVDYIAVHILPYWEGLSAEAGVDFVLGQYERIKAAFPGKPVVLTEVGWPSNGHTVRDAVPSLANEARFLRKFLNVAREKGIDYYVMEAFDQPWKAGVEGSVGAYWGIFDADRKLKFDLTGPIHPVRGWLGLFAGATALALFPIIWFLARAQAWRPEGRVFFAGLVQASATALVWGVYAGASVYMTAAGALAFAALSLALAFILVILVAEGFEMAELLWLRQLSRLFPAVAPLGAASDRPAPKVSIHLPICSEPPEMVIETLQALNRLDYPDFEVLVIDNNTRDPEVWRPVEAFCRGLGERFRFFHLDRCEGFKAGALNFALRHTHPEARIIGVIDSDYLVESDWLKSLVPYFANAGVAFVQAPQDYRDGALSAFKRMCFWEYAGFFHIGMVQRNERNAIIQHGTMTLIRRTALEEAGRWAEWCICEDAELGLRLFEAGHESIYIRRSYGRGLMPDGFAGYKRQRFRWAYGAVQILKRHWRQLVSPQSRLTLGQRYHFLSGWLPWVADALNLVFTVFGLLWTVGLVVAPKRFEFPLTFALTAAIAFFGFKLVKGLWLYAARVRCGFVDNLGASLAGLGLSYTVGRAILTGFVTSRQPFLRTPKCESQPALVRALAGVWEEMLFLSALWAGAAAIAAVYGRDQIEALIWVALLLVESVPFAAAVMTSLVATLPATRRAPAPVPAALTDRAGAVSGGTRAS